MVDVAAAVQLAVVQGYEPRVMAWLIARVADGVAAGAAERLADAAAEAAARG